MPQLREVKRVIEYGREFEGELGFLDVPEWRQDFKGAAERAEMEVREERKKMGFAEAETRNVEVRCVILTKGGEMA